LVYPLSGRRRKWISHEDLAEVDGKVETVAAIARSEGLAGILISAQHNFAWVTAGRHNRVDGSRETGVAHLLVAADGRRWLIASNIEAGRMSSEVLSGLGFEVVEFPWADERADPMLPMRIAGDMLAGDDVGTDTSGRSAHSVEPLLSRARSHLGPAEISRYRALGADASRVLGAFARRVEPGQREDDIARALGSALMQAGMRPFVLLAGADERIARYRHPVPTTRAWERSLLLVACAERHGLVVALSRIVSSRPDDELDRRTRACAEVFGRIATATVDGARGSAIFRAAQSAYSDAGYAGEERLHHQGGAIGYRSREWVAHPGSGEVVHAPQAFAWNPSIAGTKAEETFLLHEDGRIEVITHDPAWPALDIDVRGTQLRVPLVHAS
jgi:Xaa-Pro aminopeptidase